MTKEEKKEYMKKWRLANKEHIKKYSKQYKKEYYENNRESILEKQKQYNKDNKEMISEYKKQYHLDNRDTHLIKQKEWRKDNKEKISEWREINKEKISQYNKQYKKEYNKNNKEKILEYKKVWKKEKYHSDSLFKFKTCLRNRTLKAFKSKSWRKRGSTEKLLGCDYETAFNHIESQFESWMNWDNHGEWHIDHIIPISSAATKKEMKKLCHYTNLQPLLAEENWSKGDKILN